MIKTRDDTDTQIKIIMLYKSALLFDILMYINIALYFEINTHSRQNANTTKIILITIKYPHSYKVLTKNDTFFRIRIFACR